LPRAVAEVNKTTGSKSETGTPYVSILFPNVVKQASGANQATVSGSLNKILDRGSLNKTLPQEVAHFD
jgi:hypothetical protein